MSHDEEKPSNIMNTEASMQLGGGGLGGSNSKIDLRGGALTPNDEKKNKIKLFISKDKWVPDKLAKNCFNCGKVFIPLVRRKHHCRICGRIFCNK